MYSNKIKCFIFDLDGCLLFNIKANYLAYKKAFASLKINLDHKVYQNIFGLRFGELIKKIAPNLNKEKMNKIRKLKINFYRQYFYTIKLNQPLIFFLKYVKSMGFITCLCTSASENNVINLLKYFKIHNQFDIIISGDDIKNPKPNPECFYTCFKKLKLKPNNCLIFEDSKQGIAAAKKSGASYIIVNNKNL